MEEWEHLKRELLTRCRDDYVGLWVIIRNLKRLYPDSSAENIHKMTLNLLAELLSESDIHVGQFNGEVFECWSLSLSDVMSKIDKEWRLLEREPTLGDIAWLVTEEGCSPVV